MIGGMTCGINRGVTQSETGNKFGRDKKIGKKTKKKVRQVERDVNFLIHTSTQRTRIGRNVSQTPGTTKSRIKK